MLMSAMVETIAREGRRTHCSRRASATLCCDKDVAQTFCTIQIRFFRLPRPVPIILARMQVFAGVHRSGHCLCLVMLPRLAIAGSLHFLGEMLRRPSGHFAVLRRLQPCVIPRQCGRRYNELIAICSTVHLFICRRWWSIGRGSFTMFVESFFSDIG